MTTLRGQRDSETLYLLKLRLFREHMRRLHRESAAETGEPCHELHHSHSPAPKALRRGTLRWTRIAKWIEREQMRVAALK